MKKILNNIVIALVCVGIAAGGAITFVSSDFNREMKTPKIWEAFSSEDGRFNAKFPTDPTKHERELHIANTKIDFNEYSAELDNSIYAVSYLDFPGTWKLLGTNKLLTKSFEKLLEQEENLEEVLVQQLTSHDGHSALEYHIKQAGKEVKGKLVIAGNTLYRITIAYPLASAETLKPHEFLESFTLNG